MFFSIAGLAVTDFCTGLITQPSYAVLRVVVLTGNSKIKTYCVYAQLFDGVGIYFSSLTGFVITMTAVERWLHMSRRSLLTVRRVVVIYIAFAVLLIFGILGNMYARYYGQKVFNTMQAFCYWIGSLCVLVTAFAYFKVFQIIRQHRNQVHDHGNTIEMTKYKKSIFTIMYILAIFVLCYCPFLCAMLVFHISQDYGTSYVAVFNFCGALGSSSSFFNPLLCYWRIKEIRDTVKSIIRKLPCT